MNTFDSQGFTTRPPTLEDAAAVASLVSHCWRITTNRPDLPDAFTERELRADWSEPGFDLAEQACLVIAPDGQIVAVADHNATSPFVRVSTWTHVDPDYWNRGIGTWLTQWHERTAWRFFTRAPADARLVLSCSIPVTHEVARATLPDQGYQHTRSFYDMRISMDAPPPAPIIPAGITFRTMIEDQEEDAVYRAKDEAFRDHFGWVETPFAEGFASWLHNWKANDAYDPSLMVLAMDGDEIAGMVLALAKDNEDPEMGWIPTLAVRRPWRQRGLALALLQHVFGEFYRRGMKKVGLGVDASSLTGALRLYERAGMQIYSTYQTFEKEVRAGVDLVTR